MYRTHTCGELDLSCAGQRVTLAGWIQRIRKLGGMTFIDLRDRYGITQLVVKEDSPVKVKETAESLGREFVVSAEGIVVERSSKNLKIPTGEIEIDLGGISVLSPSQVPPLPLRKSPMAGKNCVPVTATWTCEGPRCKRP